MNTHYRNFILGQLLHKECREGGLSSKVERKKEEYL